MGIGYLERFVSDDERAHGSPAPPPMSPPSGKKVAVVGSGPAGLSTACDLVRRGHDLGVLEALHAIGGVLVYGILEFRLSNGIVLQEVGHLPRMGGQFRIHVGVGKTVTLDDLLNQKGYDPVFVAAGASLPVFLNIPGEYLCGVYSANEFLTRVNLMKAYREDYDEPVFNCRGREVVVIGGGNTAMDAVRTALRLGAAHATIVYRRSEAEMPARVEEIKHAREEGVRLQLLTSPVEFMNDGKGWLSGVRCIRMALGPADDSGRCRPVPVPHSEFILPAQMAVIAVGNRSNPLVQSTTPDLETTP
ncbi:MAG: FAD-dependent oxidoreductase [Limisphaera sp.]|nr:FAD-dependent oxidoreductase [Limisphaera sp.]